MIADDLSRIAMSPGLGTTLARAVELARSQGHLEVTLEHMLLALCEDTDAALVLAASNIDMAQLTGGASDFLASHQPHTPPGRGGEPAVSPDLRRILEAAAAAARGGRRREINGAIVLAAIVGDGKSAAAQLLQAQGMTFEGAIRALQRVPAAARPPTDTDQILASARERVQSRSINTARRPAPAVQGADEAAAKPEESAFGADNAPPPAPPREEPKRVEVRPTPQPPRVEVPSVKAKPAETFAAPEPEMELEPKEDVPAKRVPPREPPPKLSTRLETLKAPKKAPPQSDSAMLPSPPSMPPPIPAPGWGPPLSGPPPSPPPPERGPPPAPLQPPPVSDRMRPPPPPMPPPVPQSRPGGPAPQPGPPPQMERGPRGAGAAEHGGPSALGSLAAQRRAGPSGSPPGAPPGATAPQQAGGRQAPRTDLGQLVENIPRTMRVAVQTFVEVRVAKAQVQALAQGLQGGGAAYHHEVTVTKAMSVRLRAPDGGFYIETASPETQWIEKSMLMGGDDYASWRWHVTPRERGKKRLQLIISARTVGADGLAAETALPDQVVTVKVRTNYGKVLGHWTGWGVAALIGGLLARFGEGAYDAGQQIIAKLMAG